MAEVHTGKMIKKKELDVYKILQDLKKHYLEILEKEIYVDLLPHYDFKEYLSFFKKEVNNMSYLNEEEQHDVAMQFVDRNNLKLVWTESCKEYYMAKRTAEYRKGEYK